MGKTVLNVLLDGQMGEQGEGLEDVSNASMSDGKFDVLCGIEPDAVADDDLSVVRLGQSGYAVKESRLARSRRAKQDGESGRGLERDVQEELLPQRRQCLAKANFEPRVGLPVA